MIGTETITIHTDNGKREILLSPVLLQSKERPITKFGKIVKIYLYENWIDEEYLVNLNKENLPDQMKSDGYLIIYGQDFSKFYVGNVDVDFENEAVLNCYAEQEKINENEIKTLKDSLFSSNAERRGIVIFTPTRAADINLGHIKYLF